MATESVDTGLSSPLIKKGHQKFGLFLFVVFFSYLIAAEVAFLIGTLSDAVFAPFWPPNTVLLIALLSHSTTRRWLALVAAAPAHVIAEVRIGMPVGALIVAFITNVAVAAGGAFAIRALIGQPPWFNEFRRAVSYIVFIGILLPALMAFGGAFVPIMSGSPSGGYWTFWLQWFAANAIGSLTLGPAALILTSEGWRGIWPVEGEKRAEMVACLAALVAVSMLAISAGSAHYGPAFLPAILYAPMLIILWMTARFGIAGAATAIPATAVMLIAGVIAYPAALGNSSADTNVLAMQIFLASVAVPVLLLGSSIDQIKAAERRKHRDEERIAFIAATANVGLWSYNPATDAFWITDYCRDLLSTHAAADISRNEFFERVHPDDVMLAEELLRLDAATPELSLIEFRVTTPNNKTRWLIGRAGPGEDDTGHPIINGAVSDITPRKIAEHEADMQRRELAHLMRVSQVGELSGGLAHEITQPLTAILANAQAARIMLSGQRVQTEKLREIIDDIIAEDNRAGEVIRRLRNFLKNSADSSESIDFNEIVDSTMRLLRAEFVSRRIKTAVNLDPRLAPISGDTIQLQQVIVNLVMNAIDSVNPMTALRRHIAVQTRQMATGEVEVMVTDRGTGITAADEVRLFDPFFTTKERGLGLGLSICQTIIKRHKGSLTLRNNPQGGAIACIRLPSSRPEDKGDEGKSDLHR